MHKCLLRNNLGLLVIVLLFSVVWSSCASLFSPSKQTITFVSRNPGVTICYRGDTLGRDSVSVRMSKTKVLHSVVATQKGHIPRSYGFELQRKFAPTAIFGILDLATLLFAPVVIPFDLSNSKAHLFKKKHTIPKLVAQRTRGADEKYILPNSISVSMTSHEVWSVYYRRLTHYNKNIPYYRQRQGEPAKRRTDSAGKENDALSKELGNILAELGFADSSRSIFHRGDNTLYVEAVVKEQVIDEVYRHEQMIQTVPNNRLVSVQTKIDWKVVDVYRQTVFTTTITRNSDLFMLTPNNIELVGSIDITSLMPGHPLWPAFSQNLQLSLKGFLSEFEKTGQLKISTQHFDSSTAIAIPVPVAPGKEARLNEMLRSCVTIKVNNGHGSGVIVSEDGYIITNYHVIAGTDSAEVIFNDERTTRAKVIKTNMGNDLALLKVDRTGLRALPFADTNEPEIGMEVWAMGAPSSVELGQSISKGIISGRPSLNGLSYLQIDAKVSPGNSGGALIDRAGTILGIVSAKLIGTGTEGVAFVIPSDHILEELGMRYKR